MNAPINVIDGLLVPNPEALILEMIARYRHLNEYDDVRFAKYISCSLAVMLQKNKWVIKCDEKDILLMFDKECIDRK